MRGKKKKRKETSRHNQNLSLNVLINIGITSQLTNQLKKLKRIMCYVYKGNNSSIMPFFLTFSDISCRGISTFDDALSKIPIVTVTAKE